MQCGTYIEKWNQGNDRMSRKKWEKKKRKEKLPKVVIAEAHLVTEMKKTKMKPTLKCQPWWVICHMQGSLNSYNTIR